VPSVRLIYIEPDVFRDPVFRDPVLRDPDSAGE
jgi:hypothetical protein